MSVLATAALGLASDLHAQPTPSANAGSPLPMTCPAQLGTGLRTGRLFCDVLIATDAAGGVLIQLPKRTRVATLAFDLHTRHTYSAEQERAGTAFLRQTATVVAVGLDGRMLTRGVVRAEFRRESDLFDRITGGAGPSGLKAVAPAGLETISFEVPPSVNTVSLVGEQLVVTTITGEEVYATTGRPVAVVSRPVLDVPTPSTPARRSPRKR
jgi:hypothetical protein